MAIKAHRTISGARTRTALLDATITLLGRAGPDGLSASAIAKEARVSKATVFHHFRTLDEISVAALDRFWASLLTLDAAGTTSARGYLEGLAKQLGSVAGKRKILLYAHSVFLVKAMFNPSLRKLLVSVSAHMHQVTMRELSQRLSNDLSREEIETATRMVEMILDGMMINTALNHNTKALKAATRAWNRFLDILLRDLERAG